MDPSRKLNIYEGVNKVTVVANSTNSKRGKSAGFYCEHCDLTFKDSIQWLDHLNDRSHLYKAGVVINTRRATLQDVRDRLEMLKNKPEVPQYNVRAKIEVFRKKEQAKVNESKMKRKKRKVEANAHETRDDEEEEMMKSMGFSEFT